MTGRTISSFNSSGYADRKRTLFLKCGSQYLPVKIKLLILLLLRTYMCRIISPSVVVFQCQFIGKSFGISAHLQSLINNYVHI